MGLLAASFLIGAACIVHVIDKRLSLLGTVAAALANVFMMAVGADMCAPRLYGSKGDLSVTYCFATKAAVIEARTRWAKRLGDGEPALGVAKGHATSSSARFWCVYTSTVDIAVDVVLWLMSDSEDHKGTAKDVADPLS